MLTRRMFLENSAALSLPIAANQLFAAVPEAQSAVLSPSSFRTLLGQAPEKAPLRPQVLHTWNLDGYRRELVEYSTFANERVQVYVLTPDRPSGKLTGIVAVHQDGAVRPYNIGKDEPAGLGGDPELAYGIELCRRGHIVICPDRFPFGRRSLANSKFKQTFDGFRVVWQGNNLDLTEDLYRGCIANRLLFEGWSSLGMELLELQCAADYLCTHPRVDADKLGIIGHSAGGLLASLAMYSDSRLKVGCASTGTFLIRWIYGSENLKPITGFGSALAVPGLGRIGDINDILAGVAPRPFLETAGDQGIPESMHNELTGRARQRYAELGVPERLEYTVYPGGHVFRQDMRIKSYEWLERWLGATTVATAAKPA